MAGPIKPTRLVASATFVTSHSKNLSSKSLLRQSTYAAVDADSLDSYSSSASVEELAPNPTMPHTPPLSVLPLTSLVRSIVINTVSSSPILLPPSLKIMSILAHSQVPLLNPDRNPVLRWFLKKSFYAQFCAGENEQEVSRTVNGLKSMGFKGVMLCYAKEVVLNEKASQALESSGDGTAAELCIEKEILPWKRGTLQTVAMTEPGDFVAVKFTGAGSQALYDLSRNNSPSPALHEAITAVCDLAASRGVRLLFDAEQQALQSGILTWTLNYMRKYNRIQPVVYCTYQAYLKSAAQTLSEHLALARIEKFTIGIKLVRGAYLASDPRHLIHDTKADTDQTYDGIAESVIRKQYGPVLRAAAGDVPREFPTVSLVLACHNLESVRRAEAIRAAQAQRGESRIDMVYAQLQGMADEVSCELVQAGRARTETAAEVGSSEKVGFPTQRDVPQAYKYLVWGTTGECMKYLLRRAQENRDAVQRTREARNLMCGELVRRMRMGF